MLHGVFHGDLHGGNLRCCPTVAPPCSTSASPAASTSPAASPSCGCSWGDHERRPRPARPLRATWGPAGRHRPRCGDRRPRPRPAPRSTRPPSRPTRWVAEIRQIMRPARYGARLPKGSGLREEHGLPRRRHRHPRPRPRPVRRDHPPGPVLRADRRAHRRRPWASTPAPTRLDLDGVKASFGVDAATEGLTHTPSSRSAVR